MKRTWLVIYLWLFLVLTMYAAWTATSNTNCGANGDALNATLAKACGTGWNGDWTFVSGGISVAYAPLGGADTSFPTTGIIDNFNRAGASALGSNWSYVAFGAVANGPGIISNEVGPDTDSDYALMYWNAGTFTGGSGVEAYIDIVKKYFMDDTDAMALYLLKVVSPLDGYGVVASIYSGIDTIQIVRVDDNVSTPLLATPVNQEINDGDGLGIKKYGKDIQMWHRRDGVWSLKATVQSTTYNEPFTVGFYGSDLGMGPYRYDNIGGGAGTSTNLSIRMTGSGGIYTRAITATNNGQVRFLGRATSAALTNLAGIKLSESGTDRMLVDFGPSAAVRIWDGGTSAYQTVGTYAADTWYTIDVEFDDVAHPNQYRARITPYGAQTAGTWTSWYTVSGGSFTNIDRMIMNEGNIGGSEVWIDDIQVMPSDLTCVVPFFSHLQRRR